MSLKIPISRISLTNPRTLPYDATLKDIKWKHMGGDDLDLRLRQEGSSLAFELRENGSVLFERSVSLLTKSTSSFPPKIVYGDSKMLWRYSWPAGQGSRPSATQERFQIRVKSNTVPEDLLDLVRPFFILQHQAKKPASPKKRAATPISLPTPTPKPKRDTSESNPLLPLNREPFELGETASQTSSDEALKRKLLVDYQASQGATRNEPRAMLFREARAESEQRDVFDRPNTAPVEEIEMSRFQPRRQTDMQEPTTSWRKDLLTGTIMKPDHSGALKSLLGDTPPVPLISLSPTPPDIPLPASRTSAITTPATASEASNLIGLHLPWSDPTDEEDRMQVDKYAPLPTQNEMVWEKERDEFSEAEESERVGLDRDTGDRQQPRVAFQLIQPHVNQYSGDAPFMAGVTAGLRIYDLDDQTLEGVIRGIVCERGFETLVGRVGVILERVQSTWAQDQDPSQTIEARSQSQDRPLPSAQGAYQTLTMQEQDQQWQARVQGQEQDHQPPNRAHQQYQYQSIHDFQNDPNPSGSIPAEYEADLKQYFNPDADQYQYGSFPHSVVDDEEDWI